jgi:hypothetical protein
MVSWLAIILAGAVAIGAAVYWRRRQVDDWSTTAVPGGLRVGVPGSEAIRSAHRSLKHFARAIRGSGARVTDAVIASGARVTEAARLSRRSVVEAVRSAWQRLTPRRPGTGLAREFRTWVTNARLGDRKQLFQGLPSEAREFAAWLITLPTEQLEVFTQRIATTLAEWNIDLAWVVGQDLRQVPTLERVVERSVLLHCVAYWLASRAQDDIRSFAAYQAWQRDPYSERQKALNQRLYARLAEKGLLTAPAADVLLASDARRHDYLVQALRQVSEADAIAFSTTLREVSEVTADDATASAAVAPPASSDEVELPPQPGGNRRRRLRLPTRRSQNGTDGDGASDVSST